MDDDELTRLAEQEILRETKRAAERAAVYGALGWMKCPLKPTNKQFLLNTILPTLPASKRRHIADRQDYRRKVERMYARGFSPDNRYSAGERSSYHSKRDSASDIKISDSHRESKDVYRSDRYRHDKNKDSSPSHKSKFAANSSLNNMSKMSDSYSLENKNFYSKNSVHVLKESEHIRNKNSKDRRSANANHKLYKDDKYASKKFYDSYQHKNSAEYISAGQQYKYNVQRDYKTKVVETKVRMGGRSDVNSTIECSLGIDSENYKVKGWNVEGAGKHDKVENKFSNGAGNEKYQHSKNSNISDKNCSTVIGRNSMCGNNRKNISDSEHSHESNGKNVVNKRKKSQKRKKEKCKKMKVIDYSEAVKGEKRKITTFSCPKSSNSNVEIEFLENKNDYLRHDVVSDTVNSCSSEKTLSMQQYAHRKHVRNGQETTKYLGQFHLLQDYKNIVVKDKQKQAIRKHTSMHKK